MARASTRRRGPTAPGWNERAAFEESVRVLRSNLTVSLADIERPTVIVTSANANEGKTLICTHLAVSFAQAGRRVVVVDLDLRHSNVHRMIGGHNEAGVTDVLLGRRNLDECLQYVELPEAAGHVRQGLYFLPTGPPAVSPTELLGSGRTARLLDGLARQADLVLIDTPPVLPVADTLVIGRVVSGAVLVTEARRTAVMAVQKAKDQLIRNQTRLLGVVVNKFQRRDARDTYGYAYGYGSATAPLAVVGPVPSGNGSSHGERS